MVVLEIGAGEFTRRNALQIFPSSVGTAGECFGVAYLTFAPHYNFGKMLA
jgi:hypothetical protein